MISELQLLLSKLLPLALLPEGLLTLALIGAALSLLARAVRPARIFALAALLIFWVSATPVFANWMIATLERQHPPAPDALPHTDVAIVLGGSVGAAAPPRPSPELNEAADRIWYAAHLYRSGHVKRIMAVGGNLPWDEAPRPEGDVMRDMLVTLGVPADAISTETASRNTYENAINARAMMSGPPYEPVLLVTSAIHMPRALAIFRAAGIPADPAPCDFRSRDNAGNLVLDWLPQAGAFAMTSGALREWIGYYAYQWRGWL
jgi:uncharacterized SAM-binding protein YcdF (DUF218 family)